jgi:lipid-A-disaccharide synthase
MLSAGEASGDLHGATLAQGLAALHPGVRLSGMGGARMAAAGVELIADTTGDAVVGTSEALGRIPQLYRTYRSVARRLREDRPHALVLIDFPEFNLRLARHAKRLGVPVVYFIPPQIWAWRRGRIRQMARWVSRVLAVLPFEPALYERASVPVEFVGHPLLDVLPLDLTRDEARRRLGVGADETLVGLLPGSRREEVARLLPSMLAAAGRLQATGAASRFAVALAPTVDPSQVEAILELARTRERLSVDVRRALTYEVMAGADALLLSSGTATLEAALLGTPMVVCYRVSRVTELVLRLLARVSWCSLPNLIAERGVVPEILQDEITDARLAAEVRKLLDDPVAATAQRSAFKDLRARLGETGVGRRAARAVLEVAEAR